MRAPETLTLESLLEIARALRGYAESAMAGPFGGQVFCVEDGCGANMEDSPPMHAPGCAYAKLMNETAWLRAEPNEEK